MSTNIATICLGANTPDAAERLARAYSVLTVLGAIVNATPPYPTAPEYVGETAPYLNQIAILATQLSHDELVVRTNSTRPKYEPTTPTPHLSTSTSTS